MSWMSYESFGWRGTNQTLKIIESYLLAGLSSGHLFQLLLGALVFHLVY